jgi:ankyrin repeat protein
VRHNPALLPKSTPGHRVHPILAPPHVNAKNGTPLHLAANPLGSNTRAMDNRSVEIIEKLLAHGADVHAKDPRQGRIPLHKAIVEARLKPSRSMRQLWLVC